MIFPVYNKQSGTSLIEVLVAAVIIGIGLLGIASLQVKSLQASTNAELRAKATDLAWELADRIRTNMIVDENYVTNATNTNATNGELDSCPAVTGAPTCSIEPGGSASTVTGSGGGAVGSYKSCTPAEIAQEDLQSIFCAADTGIHNQLPGGKLKVECADAIAGDGDACSPGSEITITITWSVRDDVFGTGTDQIVMPVIPGDAT